MAAQTNPYATDPNSPYIQTMLQKSGTQPVANGTQPFGAVTPPQYLTGPTSPTAPLLSGATRDPNNPNLINFAPGSTAQQQATIAPDGSTPGSTANGGVGMNPATGQPWTASASTTNAGGATFGGGWSQFATTAGTPQYALQQGLKSGLSGQALVDQLNANPATAGIQYYPATGQYGLPGGYYVAPNASGALDLIQRSGGGGNTSGGGNSTAAYVPGQGVPGQGTVFGANNPATAQSNALVSYLLGEGTGPSSANPAFSTDPNSPIIKGQVDAYRASQEQTARTAESAAAEAAGPGAPITAETRSAQETAGQNTSSYQAQLMGQQLTARQTEIQNALSGAYGAITAEQSMMLQEELSQLQLAQTSYQYDTTQQFNNSPLAPSSTGTSGA